jgi:hypothetical protein
MYQYNMSLSYLKSIYQNTFHMKIVHQVIGGTSLFQTCYNQEMKTLFFIQKSTIFTY